MPKKSSTVNSHTKRKFRIALTLLADALDDAPEVLAGLRLNRLTGVVEAFDPKTQTFVGCSNNISNCGALSNKA
ncbi:MAG: hypothetical protein ABSH28_09960 [Acidobacteriota bacterium]